LFANRYTAVIDACSLVSVWRRNLLLSLAEAEFFRVRWSSDILAETENALARLHEKRGMEDALARAASAVGAMRRAFPEAEIGSYEQLLEACTGIPDKGDRHVLAAAIKTQAQTIVTENLKHFPNEILHPLGFEARSADDFIADTIALDIGRAIAAVRRMRLRLSRPEMHAEDLIRSLEAHDLFETATILAPHIESL
jgi:predicted nucleic acid-binding protein